MNINNNNNNNNNEYDNSTANEDSLTAIINKRHKSYQLYTLLHAATYFGQTAIVELLLQNGAKLNIDNSGSQTPLLLCNSLGVCRVLIEKGRADPYAKSYYGKWSC